jgi:hypothetical protein
VSLRTEDGNLTIKVSFSCGHFPYDEHTSQHQSINLEPTHIFSFKF